MNASLARRFPFVVLAPLALSVIVGATLSIGDQVHAIPDPKERVTPPKHESVPSRNQVNLRERNLPVDWSMEEGKLKNIAPPISAFPHHGISSSSAISIKTKTLKKAKP